MPNGFGRGGGGGFGLRGGMGFGFRGTSPPWPYVGIGRGGLPRCGYFFSGAGAPLPWPYWKPTSYGAPFAGPMTREQELDFLKTEAEALKGQLKEIEARVQELSTKKE